MSTTVEALRSRVGGLLRAASAAPALPVFSIELCWPLPVSAGRRAGRATPLVATVQFSLGRRLLPEAAGATPPRRRPRRGGEAVRQLQAMLEAARREADLEFARALLAHRPEPVVKKRTPAPADGTAAARRLAQPPATPAGRRHLLAAVSPPEPAGLQAWMLRCLSRADGVALRWWRPLPRRPRSEPATERRPEV